MVGTMAGEHADALNIQRERQRLLISARQLLQSTEHAGLNRAVRRAQTILMQARQLGATSSEIEQLTLESAVLALAQACSHAGLSMATQACGTLASSWREETSGTGCDLKALNAWVYPRSVRRYQLDILNHQPLAVELKGESYSVENCRADADRNHLLLRQLRDQSDWWLSSSECAEGYKLKDEPLQPAPNASTLPRMGKGVILRAGNDNFAHFIWNELDPLLRLLHEGRQLNVVQDNDTVLDLSQLERISRVAPECLAEHPSVRLGGTLVTAAARNTVLEALAREAPPPPPTKDSNPVILLGIRGPGRRQLHNEADYFTGLIKALTQHFDHPLILLDGFTYQHNNRHQLQSQQREQTCTQRIEAIIRRCRDAQITGRLDNLSGLTFSTWLQRCEDVSFYVTHEGTMQHKLGWLKPDIPGLCLVGSQRAEAITSWHRMQCEGAGSLSILPTDLYTQDKTPDSEPATEDRDRSFTILDVERAIALSMEQIKAQLEQPKQL